MKSGFCNPESICKEADVFFPSFLLSFDWNVDAMAGVRAAISVNKEKVSVKNVSATR